MNVPKPEPLRRFMFYCGPVLLTTAMGLGTSEVVLYPHLTCKYGTGWLGWIVLALFFQTAWGMEMARWVVVAGEHGVQANGRVISRIGAIASILLMMFIGLGIPVWATSAASALWEIIRIPAPASAEASDYQAALTQGTVIWGIATFGLVFGLIFFSRIARKWAEIVSNLTLILAWVIIVIAVFCSVNRETVGHIAGGLTSWSIPADINLWTLGSTIAWVGTGPGLISYTYWMRDAGWGMAKYSDPIPGLFGQVKQYRTSGILPDAETDDNIANLKSWIRRSHWTIWLGYFLGSLATIVMFVALSDAILRPMGVCPEGFNVVKHQAQFFVPVCGALGATLFLVMAWFLFFNTQVGISESLVRQNADATTMLLGVPIKKSYFIWWAIYLPISFVLIFLLAYYPKLTIFSYITYAAMISAVALVVSMVVTFIGSFRLYRQLPPRIRDAVRPSPVWIFILGLGAAYHIYWIVRAIMFKITG